jgi:hypothetical protein
MYLSVSQSSIESHGVTQRCNTFNSVDLSVFSVYLYKFFINLFLK